MSLAEEYARQERWRRWDEALAHVPVRGGQTVLDLGCGVGQVAARLARLGARVIGVDANEELLAAARVRHPEVHFERMDLADLRPATFGRVDGIWSSFAVAYFPDLVATLRRWGECLTPGGWIALVEIDDLFGHEPRPPEVAEDLRRFYAASRYDFESGRKLEPSARIAGYQVLHVGDLPDGELSFAGPAPEDVLEAWRRRFERMTGLRKSLGERAGDIERCVLEALASPGHRSTARVVLVVGRTPSRHHDA